MSYMVSYAFLPIVLQVWVAEGWQVLCDVRHLCDTICILLCTHRETAAEGRCDSVRRWTSFSVVGRRDIHYGVIMPVFVMDYDSHASISSIDFFSLKRNGRAAP